MSDARLSAVPHCSDRPRSLLSSLLVLAVSLLFAAPTPIFAQTSDEIPALIDFFDAWTNDDGVVDEPGLDDGDIGDQNPVFDAWGTASSDDPAGDGFGAARADKDVARCVASLDVLNSPDVAAVRIDNAYPGYVCTLSATVMNLSSFPAAMELLAVDADAGLSITPINDLDGAVLAPGGTGTGVFSVRVEQDAPQLSSLEFRMIFQVTGEEIDVELDVSAPAGTFTLGDEVVFTMTAINRGPDAATGVTVAESIDEGLRFVSATASAGTIFEPGNTWTIGNLAAGQVVTLELTLVVEDFGALGVDGEVMAHAQADVDSIPGNHVMDEDDQDRAAIDAFQVLAAAVDLSLVKTVSAATADVGETVTFTITITNTDFGTTPSGDTATPASFVQVTDSLPPGLVFLAATPAAGTTFDADTLVWDVGDIGLDESKSMTLSAKVVRTGDHSNIAEVTRAAPSNDIDSTPGNGVLTEDDCDSARVMSEVLPVTGGDLERLGGLGFGLVIAGCVLLGLVVLPIRTRRVGTVLVRLR